MSLPLQLLIWLHGVQNFRHDFWLRKPIGLMRKVSFRRTLRSDNVPFSHPISCESTHPSQTHHLRIRKFFVRKRYIIAAKTCAKVNPSQPKRGFRNHKLPIEFFSVWMFTSNSFVKINYLCCPHFIHAFEALIIKQSWNWAWAHFCQPPNPSSKTTNVDSSMETFHEWSKHMVCWLHKWSFEMIIVVAKSFGQWQFPNVSLLAPIFDIFLGDNWWNVRKKLHITLTTPP